jgi:hypothetical protein
MAGKVFGVDLDTLVQRQKSEVPKIVLHTIEYLHNKKAHLEEGIFRIPGNNIKITQLKKQFDTGTNVDLNKHNDLDVHTVACLLKMFLRELPVPVIIPRYYSTYLKVYQNPDPKQRLINFRKLVMGLPKSHRTLLMTTMEYLHLVAANQSVNKMSTLNLALIFAPNLMRAERETLTSIMEDADKVAGTLQSLIQEVEYFVSGKQPLWFSAVGAAPLSRTKSISSPPNPRVKREDSLSILLSNADDGIIVHNNNNTTSNVIDTTNDFADAAMDTLSSSAPAIYKSLLLGEDIIIPAETTTAVYDTQIAAPIPQSSAPLNASLPSSEPIIEGKLTVHVGDDMQNEEEEGEEKIRPESIPLSDSVLSALNDISELIAKPASPRAGDSDNSEPTSPRDQGTEGLPRSEPTTPRKPKKNKIEKNDKRRELRTPPEAKGLSSRSETRPKLTTSLGTEPATAPPKRRNRSLSAYLRSSSDTSLTLESLKEPDEQLIAKSVKNMRALRASCDFTDKPRRRLSILSERIAKNQAFTSHQQLKSFAAIDQ